MYSNEELLKELISLRESIISEGLKLYSAYQPHITREQFKYSALNLSYYVAARRRDLRKIQTYLTANGLSSLGRSESRVMETLDSVIINLNSITGNKIKLDFQRPSLEQFFKGEDILKLNSSEIFGESFHERDVKIMVTLPESASEDYKLVKNLLMAGTNIFRINCAHDTQEEWEKIIHNIRRAETSTGIKAKISMDIGGPKIRLKDLKAPKKKHSKVFKDELILLTKEKQYTDHLGFSGRCSIPEILDEVKLGNRVVIDDGKIITEVVDITAEGVLLRVKSISPEGKKLKNDKGINFPDCECNIPPITKKDKADIKFILNNADILGYSFVQTVKDIDLLEEEIMKNGPVNKNIAIIAKIETKLAVNNLPGLIAHAAGKFPFAIMIARGDLAVEIGYERLAEMQEEILWICEAAHVPVIWATQVLETLVKDGIPTRAEITDAAMSERAECVMLNKGEYIVEAVNILDNVLRRMQMHQLKKTPQLRALKSW